MAVIEGLCPNCGSLIQMDSAQDKERCIFCWAEVDPSFAQSLLADSSNYEFPNESIPQPTQAERQAHMLQQMGQTHAAQQVIRQQPQPKKRREDKMSPAEKVKLMTRPIVEPVASKKSLMIMLAGIVGFLVLFFLIFTPLYLQRTDKMQQLEASMDAVFPFTVEEENVSLEGQSNRSLMVVSPEEVTEDIANTVFDNFAALYANVYDISADTAKSRVDVEVIGPSGGYYIENSVLTQRNDLPEIIEEAAENEESVSTAAP